MKSDDNLTPKQSRFCDYYLQSYNATKAYQMAYPNVKYSTARRDGYRLMTNDDINAKITDIRKHQSTKLHCDRLDVLRRLIAMFFADVGDYVSFGNHPATDKNGDHYQRSYLYFKNDKDVDTRLIQSISKGRNGTRVELPNKIQLAALLMQYLPSPPNMDIRRDSLVVAFENGLKQMHHRNRDDDSKSNDGDTTASK